MMTEVPHVLKGFLIVAILSAAMSSVSSALTSLASVSTMDFVRHALHDRSERFYLRFSKISTIAWAVGLILIAYVSRKVEFVLNAAFSLRGLTSGALLGGLALAVFWKKGRSALVIPGMLFSLAVMILIQLDSAKKYWMSTVGTEIFWPWYALIGAVVTIGAAWLMTLIIPPKKPESVD